MYTLIYNTQLYATNNVLEKGTMSFLSSKKQTLRLHSNIKWVNSDLNISKIECRLLLHITHCQIYIEIYFKMGVGKYITKKNVRRCINKETFA